MLDSLRIRLTLLYLSVAILFASLVSISAYFLIAHYFQSNNDEALSYEMAVTFINIDIPLPTELENAITEWSDNRPSLLPGEIEEEDDESEDIPSTRLMIEDYEEETSSIFLLPLNDEGQILFNPNPFILPINPDLEAVEQARIQGHDLRTISLPDNQKFRILTYKTPISSGYAYLQLGKSITEQQRILNQLLSGLLITGVISIFILGCGSWWMAGSYLRTTQIAWDKQQQFIANASHELRTPLTLMRANAEVARRKCPKEDQLALYLDDIVGEVDHMTRLVEDLLLQSRLDSDSLKMDMDEIDLASMLPEIQKAFNNLVQNQQIDLVVNSFNGKIIGDRLRLRQVMLIIFDNVLQHAATANQIELKTIRENKNICIEIRDNGEGIDPQHLDQIFDRFYQADSSRVRKGKGSGLGLSIARALVEKLQGKISIESQKGSGTSISILLPTPDN